MSTRLQKMARMATTDLTRESIVAFAVEEASSRIGITFKFRNFTDEACAMKWLSES